MLKDLDEYRYLHSDSEKISEFAREMSANAPDTEQIIKNIFSWFGKNVEYSRLDSPYYPLQRSDLDTLRMKSGTCGDYSNLIVSTLLNLGIPAKYALVKKDCYGHSQDHICAMAKVDDNWVLIDATLPNRKWLGYNTPHMEYEVYSPDEFENKFKGEERYWANLALKWGKGKYAGLLYAPWIHEEVEVNTEETLDTIFYLLILNGLDDWNLYVYYLSYTPEIGISPIMAIINPKKRVFKFSIYKGQSIWDDEQWSKEYDLDKVPENFKDEKFKRLNNNIEKTIDRVLEIIAHH